MILKRAFDIIFSAIALVASLPILIILAGWIKLDSKGPVFFRQVRIGRRGEPFRIWKLRTMHPDVDDQRPQITIGRDPRVTRAGAVIRRLKLDELPQFMNVLLGDMSIVGPRPEVPKYVSLYDNDIRKVVLSVRPGITDSASLLFSQESDILGRSADPELTYITAILPRKLEIAQLYIVNRSFVGDLKIIVSTAAKCCGAWRRRT